MPAYVYILSNEAMPGMVKIGRTRLVEERVRQLSGATGVPCDFVSEHATLVDWPEELEAVAHARLADRRVNPRREFFRVSVAEARHELELSELIVAWNNADGVARREFLARLKD